MTKEEPMDASAQAGMTIGKALGWINYIFGRSEATAAAIPGELAGWRPPDPSGAFQFSLAEIVMHMADARRMFASQLTGADETPRYWSPDYWTAQCEDEALMYRFKDFQGREALLQDLKEARSLYAPYLALPMSSLMLITEGSRTTFARMVADYRAAGQDTVAMEQFGPPSIYQVLLMAVAHEAGHRGALHALLRTHGVDLSAV
jgi:uncharacterized damage-inducible protein DinB